MCFGCPRSKSHWHAASRTSSSTVFPDCYHFWCYWHIAKNVAKNLKGKLGDEAFKRLAAQMSRAHRQVSIAAFNAIWDGILSDPEFAAARDYLLPTWGADKVRKWARCFQVGVFTRGIVSTQRVEGIHRWTKEGRLNRKKKLWQLFEALVVIVSELMIRGLREGARTTGSYRQRHELMEKKERLTTWGLDEQVKQMALAQEYRVEQCPIEDLFNPLPIEDVCPDSKPAVDPLLEMDLPGVAHVPPPSALFFKVSKPTGTHPQFVHLIKPGVVPIEGGRLTLYRDVFCTCGFNAMLGLGCRHYWAVMKESPYAAFRLGLIHAQYFLEDQPVHDDYPLMQRFLLVSLTQANNRPAPVIRPHEVPEGIVPKGEGPTSTLLREAELQKLWYRVQLKALWREFEDVAVSSTELFQDARATLQTWIEAQKRPLGPELKAANPPKPPAKSSKRKASEEAMGGKRGKKKNTPAPEPVPNNVVVTLPYTQVPLSPLVPIAPVAPVGEDPDVVVTRRVPPPSPFQTAPMLPVAPPYAYSQASVAPPYPVSQATSSSQLPTQCASLSYPVTLSNPPTQGSQAPLPPNMQCFPYPGFSPTTDAAYFPLTQLLNPVSAPVPPPKKGRGTGNGKKKSKGGSA